MYACVYECVCVERRDWYTWIETYSSTDMYVYVCVERKSMRETGNDRYIEKDGENEKRKRIEAPANVYVCVCVCVEREGEKDGLREKERREG